jgi:hypothetical protein
MHRDFRRMDGRPQEPPVMHAMETKYNLLGTGDWLDWASRAGFD